MTHQHGYNADDEQRLRDALRYEADQVMPSANGLERIRERVRQPDAWYRRPLALAAAGVTATAGVVVAATLVLSSISSPGDSASGPSSSATENTPKITALPVYYATDGPRGGTRLTREFHQPGTTEPIAASITDMIAGPKDPDYTTLWKPQTEVKSAKIEDRTIVVDLGDAGFKPAARNREWAAVQQLVYTATAAASAAYPDVKGSLPVQVLIDGELPSPQQRKQLNLARVENRVPELKIRQLVQIDNPADGARVPSPVTVDGSATAPEGTLRWEVRKRDGGPAVESGTTTAKECCKFAAFSFQLQLEPGSYVVAVSDTDPSGGEGIGITTDTKRFTVVP